MFRALDASLRCKSGVALRLALVSGLLRNPRPPIIGLKHRPQLSLVTPVSAVRTPARFSSQTCQVSKGAAPGSPDWNPPDGDSSGAWGQGGIQASGGIQIGGTLRVRQGPVNAPVWGYTRGPRRGPKMGLFWGSWRGQKYPLFGPSGTPSQGGLPGGAPGGPRGADFGPRGARGAIFGPPKTTLSCF